jgi:hypothetical protein
MDGVSGWIVERFQHARYGMAEHASLGFIQRSPSTWYEGLSEEYLNDGARCIKNDSSRAENRSENMAECVRDRAIAIRLMHLAACKGSVVALQANNERLPRKKVVKTLRTPNFNPLSPPLLHYRLSPSSIRNILRIALPPPPLAPF